jgi:hypothetical protein
MGPPVVGSHIVKEVGHKAKVIPILSHSVGPAQPLLHGHQGHSEGFDFHLTNLSNIIQNEHIYTTIRVIGSDKLNESNSTYQS